MMYFAFAVVVSSIVILEQFAFVFLVKVFEPSYYFPFVVEQAYFEVRPVKVVIAQYCSQLSVKSQH